MNEKALAIPGEFGEIVKIGEVFVRSGYFTDVKEGAQAIVKIMAGKEMGIGPFEAMQGLYIVKGKLAMSSNLIAARIKKSGRYDYRIVKHTEELCELVFFEGGTEIGRSSFSLKDAEKAGLLNNETWRKYARNLLFARALTNGARWYCPDAFSGPVYTPEELRGGDVEQLEIETQTVDVQTGEVIEAEAVKPASNGNERDKVWSAIVHEWELRAETETAFQTDMRRKNSVHHAESKGVIHTQDIRVTKSADWLEEFRKFATIEDLKAYGRYNRTRREEEQAKAAKPADEQGALVR